jgi:hypothetical protein
MWESTQQENGAGSFASTCWPGRAQYVLSDGVLTQHSKILLRSASDLFVLLSHAVYGVQQWQLVNCGNRSGSFLAGSWSIAP